MIVKLYGFAAILLFASAFDAITSCYGQPYDVRLVTILPWHFWALWAPGFAIFFTLQVKDAIEKLRR